MSPLRTDGRLARRIVKVHRRPITFGAVTSTVTRARGLSRETTRLPFLRKLKNLVSATSPPLRETTRLRLKRQPLPLHLTLTVVFAGARRTVSFLTVVNRRRGLQR